MVSSNLKVRAVVLPQADRGSTPHQAVVSNLKVRAVVLPQADRGSTPHQVVVSNLKVRAVVLPQAEARPFDPFRMKLSMRSFNQLSHTTYNLALSRMQTSHKVYICVSVHCTVCLFHVDLHISNTVGPGVTVTSFPWFWFPMRN